MFIATIHKFHTTNTKTQDESVNRAICLASARVEGMPILPRCSSLKLLSYNVVMVCSTKYLCCENAVIISDREFQRAEFTATILLRQTTVQNCGTTRIPENVVVVK